MGEVAPGAEFGEAGRYRLLRLVGTGGMASVWLAEDARLQREVAVKVLSDVLALDPEFVARFEREARLAAGLAHPHLVNVYDFGSQGPRPYLVMEYVGGGTLADSLRGGGGPPRDPLALSRELLDALGHVHAAGIVHRDIKPASVLIGLDGRVRLTDFGIAQPTEATRLTSTGNILGTERYLAPEVYGGRPADARSDLYSLGVLLRECLGASAPPQLHRLVDLLTKEDPGDRPASAAEALAVLSGAESGAASEPAGTRRLTGPVADATRTALLPTVQVEPEKAPRPRSRSAKVLAAAAAAAAVLLVVGVVALQGEGGDQAEPLVVPPPGGTLSQQLDALDASIDRARR
jgi:serine/threonine protein kinase